MYLGYYLHHQARLRQLSEAEAISERWARWIWHRLNVFLACLDFKIYFEEKNIIYILTEPRSRGSKTGMNKNAWLCDEHNVSGRFNKFYLYSSGREQIKNNFNIILCPHGSTFPSGQLSLFTQVFTNILLA